MQNCYNHGDCLDTQVSAALAPVRPVASTPANTAIEVVESSTGIPCCALSLSQISHLPVRPPPCQDSPDSFCTSPSEGLRATQDTGNDSEEGYGRPASTTSLAPRLCFPPATPTASHATKTVQTQKHPAREKPKRVRFGNVFAFQMAKGRREQAGSSAPTAAPLGFAKRDGYACDNAMSFCDEAVVVFDGISRLPVSCARRQRFFAIVAFLWPCDFAVAVVQALARAVALRGRWRASWRARAYLWRVECTRAGPTSRSTF